MLSACLTVLQELSTRNLSTYPLAVYRPGALHYQRLCAVPWRPWQQSSHHTAVQPWQCSGLGPNVASVQV